MPKDLKETTFKRAKRSLVKKKEPIKYDIEDDDFLDDVDEATFLSLEQSVEDAFKKQKTRIVIDDDDDEVSIPKKRNSSKKIVPSKKTKSSSPVKDLKSKSPTKKSVTPKKVSPEKMLKKEEPLNFVQSSTEKEDQEVTVKPAKKFK